MTYIKRKSKKTKQKKTVPDTAPSGDDLCMTVIKYIT